MLVDLGGAQVRVLCCVCDHLVSFVLFLGSEVISLTSSKSIG